MKIVHVAETFSGGVFQFLVNLINGLPFYEHVVIYGNRVDQPEKFKEFFPKTTQFQHWERAVREIRPKKDMLAAIELLRLLKKIDNYQVVHLHSAKAGFIGRIVARLVNVADKTIYTPHGLAFVRQDIAPGKRYLYKVLERLAAATAGKVVACSQSECAALRQSGIKANYVNNGISTATTVFDKPYIPKKKVIVGTVGRITYAKNPSLFNEIAACFRDIDKVEFVWVGDGEMHSSLLAENIRITGWLTQDEVMAQLKTFDIYLSTSLWEGLPFAVLQAMAVGLPLVLTNCVGNRDLVTDNGNGFLFSDRETGIERLKELISRPELREQMALVSENLLQKSFSQEAMCKGYSKIYEEIAQVRGK